MQIFSLVYDHVLVWERTLICGDW